MPIGAYRDVIKSGMRQAFIMAEAAVDAVGRPPSSDGDVKWIFPEEETQDMSARIFGTDFDVEFDDKVNRGLSPVNKYSVVRGKIVGNSAGEKQG